MDWHSWWQTQFWVTTDLVLSVVDADGSEIFGKAFVEPSLDFGIVVVEEQVGEVVGDGAPGFLLGQIEHDEVLVFARQEKAGNIYRLTLVQRRRLVIVLVVLESDNRQRQRLVKALLHQQDSEDRPHLLEAHGNFFAFSISRVGDDGEVRGVDLKPRRRLGSAGGETQKEHATCQKNANGSAKRAGHAHACGERREKC